MNINPLYPLRSIQKAVISITMASETATGHSEADASSELRSGGDRLRWRDFSVTSEGFTTLDVSF